MNRIPTLTLLFCAISLVVIPTSAGGVTIAWSPVGNPGNALDPLTGHGAVAYSYNIGTYDVTNSQYAEFLNAKDPTGANTLGLWNIGMASATFGYGGINFNAGNADGDKYTLVSGRENHPVGNETWYSAIRFANWLNNGQGSGDTESGAYTLLGGTPTPSNGLSVTRNAGATVFLPSEDEWYKAAYYNPGTNSYFLYPTSSNVPPIASPPTPLANHANLTPTGAATFTDVGAYSGTASPYGAFDMAGDTWQWTETLNGVARVQRGASWVDSPSQTASSYYYVIPPQSDAGNNGFRLAMIPEPSTLVLAALGFGALAAFAARRRQSTRGETMQLFRWRPAPPRDVKGARFFPTLVPSTP